MFIIAHLVAGLLIGKVTQNYSLALAVSVLIDLDHLIPYARHGVLLDAKRFWKTVTDRNDPYGNQRNYLHSFITWAVVSAIALLAHFEIGLVITLAYLAHLVLDLLDGSDFSPLYPVRYIVRGPIPYLSAAEFAFTFFLFLVYLVV